MLRRGIRRRNGMIKSGSKRGKTRTESGRIRGNGIRITTTMVVGVTLVTSGLILS
jgi:hypothetical protein